VGIRNVDVRSTVESPTPCDGFTEQGYPHGGGRLNPYAVGSKGVTDHGPRDRKQVTRVHIPKTQDGSVNISNRDASQDFQDVVRGETCLHELGRV